MSARTVIQTDAAPGAIGPYNQAIVAAGLVFAAGQVGLDPATRELREGVEAQAEQAVANLRTVLQAAGSGLERVLKVLADLITVKFLDRFQQKPMYLFGAVGLASLGVSLASGIYALWRKFIEHEAFIKNPLLLLSVLTAMTGIMCVLMGLLAEMIMRTFYESQGKSVYLVKATRNIEPKCAV